MKKARKILLLLLLSSFFFFGISVVQAYTIENFGIDHGLSHNSVTVVLQDSQGFLWIGTMEGLNKYDGYQFTVFRHDPLDSSKISNNYIYSLAEDALGNIWIGTQYGLNKYDRYSGTFEHFSHDPFDPNTLSDNRVQNIHIDINGIVWLKTPAGLDKLNPKTKRLKRYRHYVNPFSSTSEYHNFSITEDHLGKLWIGSRGGLLVFDPKNEQFKTYLHKKNDINSLSSDVVRYVYEDYNFNIWIGTSEGLDYFDVHTNKFTRYKNTINNNSKHSNMVNVVFEDYLGRLIVGTESGLFKFDTRSKTFSQYFIGSSNTAFSKKNIITSIAEDNSHILWIGSWGGLYKLDTKKQKFRLYQKDENGQPPFSSSNVISIYVPAHNRQQVWFGTPRNGLNIYNRKTGDVTIYSSESSQYKIPANRVQVIYQDLKNNIWIGTDNGPCIFNNKTQQFSPFFAATNSKWQQIFTDNRINDILHDKADNYWFATNHGLHKFDGKTLKQYYFKADDLSGISADEVYTLLQSKDGEIWIGTLDGLNLYQPESDSFTHYKKNRIRSKGLSNNSVTALFEDPYGFLWIGTRAGLNRFDKDSKTFQFFTQQDADNEGFNNDYIHAIEADGNGNIWLSTNRGISRFNPWTDEITNFTKTDGLQGYEFNYGASCRASQELFFGGVKGWNSFYTDSIITNEYIPPTTITGIEVLGEKGKRHLHITGKKNFTFRHSDYMITIEFAALEFTHPEKNSYVYMMEGLNDEWIKLGNRNSVSFQNIPSGDYVFRVKGANSDLVWTPKSTDIKITIRPPIWKSTYAYVFYAAFALIVLYLLIFYTTRNLRRANQVLQEKQKTATKIKKQKEELDIIHKNITDSMNYAQRIIKGMMPSERQFAKILPRSFVFFKPKDIVSGDFYWIVQKNDKIFITAVDCTGHGIPGAFMSIIGFDLLRNIVLNKGIERPADILNAMNQGVADTFRDADEINVKDGMDLSFCVIDKKNKRLEYAGAYNPLYIIRDNNILEHKADRFSVGQNSHSEGKSFSNIEIDLKEGDMCYIFTDGFADQFGGPSGRKFKFRRFRHLLLTIHKMSMDEQRKVIERTFNSWRGDVEQVDDVLLIGIDPLAE